MGASTAVAWPEGVGGKGNEGVASYVQRIKGAIGYVEYAYAKHNKMTHVALQNKDGQFVQPDDDAFQAAAAYADWKIAARLLPDPHRPARQGELADHRRELHPDARSQDKPASTAEVLKFFDWALKNGQKMAEELDYVPLPDAVVKLIADVEGAGQGRRQGVWN